MLNSIRYFVVGLIVGIIAGAVAVTALQPKADKKAHITARTISGAPLTLGEVKTRNRVTTICASYTDAGKSEISIPDAAIPAANAWDSRRWIVGGFAFTDKTVSIGIGYRWESVMIIGGPWVRNSGGYHVGMWAGAFGLFCPPWD